MRHLPGTWSQGSHTAVLGPGIKAQLKHTWAEGGGAPSSAATPPKHTEGSGTVKESSKLRCGVWWGKAEPLPLSPVIRAQVSAWR